MNRNNWAALLAISALSLPASLTVAAHAQQGSQPEQQGAYQGVSQPPADRIEVSPDPLPAKPSAGVVASANNTSVAPMPSQPTSDGSFAEPQPAQQLTRQMTADPDGDIVHPRPARPGEVTEGTTIRVRLMDRLSSAESERGQPFRGQIVSDVLQDGRVMIPSGSSIEGRVTNVSSGHFAGHGSFRLRPEVVILPDGSRYELHAYTTGTPGSKTRIGSEGSINPGSRAKRNGIEYGAVVGTGAVAGAVLGGPVGALTGSLIGAGMVTTHIMVNHAQATLEPGAVLLFTLTEPMNLMPGTN